MPLKDLKKVPYQLGDICGNHGCWYHLLQDLYLQEEGNKVNTKEIIFKIREIITLIDKWDDTILPVLKQLSNLPGMPGYFKIAIELMEKYEPSVLKYALSIVSIVEDIFGDKQGTQKALYASKYLSIEKINDIISVINKAK